MYADYATLEITTKVGCPVACTYCPQAKTAKNYKGENLMTVETLGKCLDKVPQDITSTGGQRTRIEFSGFCEPYANPNCSDLINLVYDKGFRNITLYTTFRGMKLNDFERIKHIPFAFVSIHLPDEEGLAKIPIHDDYFKLLERMIDTYEVGFFAYGKMNSKIMKFIAQKEPMAVKGKFNWVVNVHSRAGNVDGITPIARKSGHIKCSAVPNMEFNHNILLPNGDVSVCCMDFSLQHIIGNLLRDDYYDLYKSAEHNKMVAGVYVDEMNSMCRICDYSLPNNKN
jgi:hypothetical protein